MKKLLGVLCLLMLMGCSSRNQAMDRAMEVRSRLLHGEGCRFVSHITADYGDTVHNFTLSSQGDSQGNITFTVEKPDTLSGISGRVSDTGGQLTFDDAALQFDLLTDRQLSPVSAPWIFLRTLRKGYLLSAGEEEGQIHLTARDSYEEDSLFLDIFLGEGDLPVRAEILYRDRRILTLEIENFQILGSGQDGAV